MPTQKGSVGDLAQLGETSPNRERPRPTGRDLAELGETLSDGDSSQNVKSKWKPWAVMLAVFVASIAAAANRFKVPPVMQALMAVMQVDMVTGGWFMSMFSVV